MPRAAGLAQTLLGEFTNKIDELKLIPGDGGRFEVSLDGQEVFSKKKEGRFPEEDEIRTAVKQRL